MQVSSLATFTIMAAAFAVPAHAQGDYNLSITGGGSEQLHFNASNHTWDNDTTGESGTWAYEGNDIKLFDDNGNLKRVLKNAKDAAQGATDNLNDVAGNKIGTWLWYEARLP